MKICERVLILTLNTFTDSSDTRIKVYLIFCEIIVCYHADTQFEITQIQILNFVKNG